MIKVSLLDSFVNPSTKTFNAASIEIENGTLAIKDSSDRLVAAFAQGFWTAVEEIEEPAAGSVTAVDNTTSGS